MKVKDIINEAGFFKSFAAGLVPTTMQTVVSNIKKPNKNSDTTDIDLAQQAYKKFGAVPGKESLGSLGWLTPDQLSQLPNSVLDRLSDKQKKELNVTAQRPISSTAPITHPDVSVTSSYPLRLRYKNGDYVLDPATNQWKTITGKKVSPELASFLQYQANKL